MVSGYSLTAFPNAIYATTTATKSKCKSNNRQQPTQRAVHSQQRIGTAQSYISSQDENSQTN